MCAGFTSFIITFFRATCRIHAKIVPVNGHRKQQIELYREPTSAVSFSNFIDPRLTYNKRCMAVLTGAPRTARGNTFTQLYKIYKLPYELGGTPFGQRA